MQQNKNQTAFRNYFYDSLYSFLYDHFSKYKIRELDNVDISDEEDRLLCEYGVIKNLLAGVREVNLTCNNPINAINALDKYGLEGFAVVDGMIDMPEINGRVMVHIKDVLSCTENELQDIAIKVARSKVPIMITYGRSLLELGTIDKEYGMPPAVFLESLGFLDRGCVILGGNALEKDDLSLFASYDTQIVVSPMADMYLARGFVNLSPLLSQEIKVGFASEVFPEVNMLGELELGVGQTANLMRNDRIVKVEDLIDCVLLEGDNRKALEGRLIHNLIEINELQKKQILLLRYRDIENILIKKFKEKLWK